jgi:DNA-binding GntR family transcriptional regulator
VIDEPGDQDIYLFLSEALLSGRLSAGAKLGEHRLAGVLGVSRERVRKVLQRLGNERLILLIPNRGAFVPTPSLDDARQIYEARRIVEGGIAWRIAEALSVDQLQHLRRHLADEQRAHARNDQADAIRLSGAFHLLLAQMTGNDLIVRQMQELVSRTSMLVALLEDHSVPGCGVDEHSAILAGLEQRNPAAAARAMTVHLSLIETRLRPRATLSDSTDMADTLQALLRARRRSGAKRGKPGRAAGG